MKQSLQLKMGQQLTMTPQLRQAIRLLQLSTLDLQQEIQEIIESNPMLEAEDIRPTESEEEQFGEQEPNFSDEVSGESIQEESEWATDPSFELFSSGTWSDIYPNYLGTFSDNNLDNLSSTSAIDSLQDHLEWQLNLTSMTNRDRLIGLTIIEATNASGYLSCSLDDIVQTLMTQLDEIGKDEVLVVQHHIQQFDPIGCASEGISQCLNVQLDQQPIPDDLKNIIRQLTSHYLKLLATHDYAGIIKKMQVKKEMLSKALNVIHSLNPRPGADIGQSDSGYVTPDIIVSRKQDRWQVCLNNETIPKLKINNNYASMVQRANDSTDNIFLKNNLQEARWLLQNLQNRNETLLKVAQKIVEYQQRFFTEGEAAMKPLVLTDIAKAVDMHESTISRVTTQKYIHTPKGLFELKYFFSSHVHTQEGGECSSTAIRALIKQLVAAENSCKPLSDSKISILLKEQGIKVARRTIAKYRESLSIPPSNERKHLA